MTRQKAIELVDNHIAANFGMSVHDLADSCEFCDIYDTIEDMEESEAKAYVKSEIDMDMIAENVFG